MVDIDSYVINNKLNFKELYNDVRDWIHLHDWNSIEIRVDNYVIIELTGNWNERGVFEVITDIANRLGVPDHINTELDGNIRTITLKYVSIEEIKNSEDDCSNVDDLIEEIDELNKEDFKKLLNHLNKKCESIIKEKLDDLIGSKEVTDEFFRWL